MGRVLENVFQPSPMLHKCHRQGLTSGNDLCHVEGEWDGEHVHESWGRCLLVDKGLKNKWRWAWIEEVGKDGKPFGSWCKKLGEAGTC